MNLLELSGYLLDRFKAIRLLIESVKVFNQSKFGVSDIRPNLAEVSKALRQLIGWASRFVAGCVILLTRHSHLI